MRLLFLFLCLLTFSFAKNEVYLLPNEAEQAKETIVKEIKKAKESITIAMYNFSYKKFAKALAKAQKRGVNVTVVFDAKKIKEKDSLYGYLKDKGITCVTANKKMHLKLALFDETKLIIGSANFTKKSFSDNYEILLMTSDKKSISKVNAFLKELI